MKEPFYRAFEEHYRGNQEQIKERLSVYIPFIEPIKLIYTNCQAVDLGCGRGEWLEILSEHGFSCCGIDLDSSMFDSYKNLNVQKADALEFLKNLSNESLTVVSGFHLIEHLSFDYLQQIIIESLRVLKPAGLLILESPNAENLLVGSNNFYLDPTHKRPIPHLLLSFLVQYIGFTRYKLLRVQEPPLLVEKQDINLFDVLTGVSPDYGIVAQKYAPLGDLTLFNPAFNKDYGLTLNDLSLRYDNSLKNKIHSIEQKLNTLNEQQKEIEVSLRGSLVKTIQSEIKYTTAEALNIKTSRELETLQQQLTTLQQQVETKKHQLENVHNQLHDVFNSTSWKLTKPLRTIIVKVREYKTHTKSRKIISATKQTLISILRFFIEKFKIKNTLSRYLRRYPNLFNKIRLFSLRHGLLASKNPTNPELYINQCDEEQTARSNQIHMKLEEQRMRTK